MTIQSRFPVKAGEVKVKVYVLVDFNCVEPVLPIVRVPGPVPPYAVGIKVGVHAIEL